MPSRWKRSCNFASGRRGRSRGRTLILNGQQDGGGPPWREGIFRVCLLVLNLDAKTQKLLMDEMRAAPEDAAAEDEAEDEAEDY
ncbi:hypothetical protein GPECTOR_6g549 [Gonium pectorale]|uniref:Uncharacterized protein n=1 Tax=Gonium pectorale TaxID=33097 RepID=A0A150GVA3_GONPE|nr:hypothetical protein GPECTOR_6g549 [Gonium pectorale]|eukprot:KXZ53632.1 hypothetical protein GPECTOR_6g549 [Gonium pectorale]